MLEYVDPALPKRVDAWTSPIVGMPMSIVTYGERGRPLLLFPTAAADFLENERFFLVKAIEPAIIAGRVRLFGQYIQHVDGLLRYDFIISGLPLTAFKLRDVKTILDILKRYSRPDCVFSYFEYIGIRPVLAAVRLGAPGKRFRMLSTYLDREIAQHQVGRQTVLLNIPPACARHLKFEGLSAEQ